MSVDGMNGHTPGDPEWCQHMEQKLNRLVYETENGGLIIENNVTMDSLTSGDGSELHSDKVEDATTANALRDGIKAGEFALEESGYLETSNSITPVQQWYQLLDVFGIQPYATETRMVSFSHVDRLPRLLNGTSSADADTLERITCYVPACMFRDTPYMYRHDWSSNAGLRSEEDGTKTSGRGRVLVYPCKDVPQAFATMKLCTMTEEEARQDAAGAADRKLRLVTYMGKDPILPYYVYQLHTVKGKNGSVVRRLQRTPMPCTADSVLWITAYALEKPEERVADMLASANYILYSPNTQQKNWIDNDDADRLAVFNHIYNALRDCSRQSLDSALRTLAEAEEKDPLDMINEADGLKMPHVEFIKHPEVTRYFGGKRFTVLSRYFRTDWLGTLTVPQICALFDRVMTRPFDFCFPGKRQWLLKDSISGDIFGQGAPPLPRSNLPNRHVFVPEITTTSCALIHLDMLSLRSYLNKAREEADELVRTWGKPFPSTKSSSSESVAEYLDYIDTRVQQFLNHGSEELFVKACAYEMTRKLQVEGNHMYLDLGVLTEALKNSIHCKLTAAVMLNANGNEVVSMFRKVKVLNALHSLADGVPKDAEHAKLLAVVMGSDGSDGMPIRLPTEESRAARLADLKKHSNAVKVYPIHMYEMEAMVVFVVYKIALRRLALHLSGDSSGVKALKSHNPDVRMKWMLENCSEQIHSALQIEAGRAFILKNGPGGAGKSQCLKMLNDQTGIRGMGLVSFMATHIDTLMKRVGPTARGTTIHRLMSLHSKLCRDADTCKYMPAMRRALFNNSAMRYLETLMQSYKLNEKNSDLHLLKMGWRVCPFEDIERIAFEEASLLNSHLFISELWMLYRCSPNFSTVIMAGDAHQMPSINGDLLFPALIEAFGQCEFDHVHRFKDRTLRRNADAIRDQNVCDFAPEPIPLQSVHRYDTSKLLAYTPAVKKALRFKSRARQQLAARDVVTFDRTKYQSGVFHVEVSPERTAEMCEYMIYRLHLTPEKCQFIMRTNAEVAELRFAIRNALLCTARALSVGMDPHVYAIRNYGTREQIERFERASPDGKCFGRLDPTTMLVFSQNLETDGSGSSRSVDGAVKVAPKWSRPNVEGASQLEQSGRLDQSTGYTVGQIIQTTRNVPSLHINNLGRSQFVCCLYVRLELFNDDWDPTDENIVALAKEFNVTNDTVSATQAVTSVLQQDKASRAAELIRGKKTDAVEEAAREHEEAVQLYGDRQWALEQMNAQRLQMREIEQAKKQRDAASDADDTNRTPGCDYDLQQIMQNDQHMPDHAMDDDPIVYGTPGAQPCIKSQHEWLSAEARMYLYTAIASESISIAYASDLIRQECSKRATEQGYTCMLCKHSLPGKLYLDMLPEDIIRQLIKTHKRPKGLLSVLTMVEPKKIKLRIVKVQRTTAWDRELATKNNAEETPGFRILMTREITGAPALQKDIESWIHRGIYGHCWSETRAQDYVQLRQSALSHTDIKFIPFEGHMCQLVRDGACVTMHAMQGNQAHTVCCVMARGSRHCSYKHIYSGSTRPTDCLIYVGSKHAIKQAILTEDPVRNSDLGRILRKLVNEKLGLDANMRVDLRLAAIVEMAENNRFGRVSNSIAARYLAEPHMQSEEARALFEQEVCKFERRKRIYDEAKELGLPWDATQDDIDRFKLRNNSGSGDEQNDTSDSDSDSDSDGEENMLDAQLKEAMSVFESMDQNMLQWKQAVEKHMSSQKAARQPPTLKRRIEEAAATDADRSDHQHASKKRKV